MKVPSMNIGAVVPRSPCTIVPNSSPMTGLLWRRWSRRSSVRWRLSVKVFAGQCRLTELGFRQGGSAGYGLRRLLLDQDGKSKCVLKRGEYKSIATDRVVLIPGPSEEVEVVREIFPRYV